MKLVLFLYSVLLALCSPFAFVIGYIITKRRGGETGFGERFGLIRLKGGARRKSVWFHCASVGEVRSIKTLADGLRQRYPDICIIVSTMTVTGRREAEVFIKADEAFLLPIENASAISYLIKLLGVKVFFITDTEIWPNLIWAAGTNARLILINGKISEKTFKNYYRFRFFLRPFFRKFSAILAKSSGDFSRFVKIIGSDKNVAELGNIKFKERKKISETEPVHEFDGLKYFFAASTHAPEEEIIIDGFKLGGADFDRLIIAPRHIERSADIKSLAESKGFSAALFSEKTSAKVIIIDCFGLLERLYAYADKIFVGGSLVSIGGHNIYEALQFEKKVAVGQYMDEFAEIYLPARDAGLVQTVKDAESIALWLRSPDSTGDFAAFFRLINEKNKEIIIKIEGLIDDLLASETDSIVS